VAKAYPKPERMEKISRLGEVSETGLVKAYLLFVGLSVAGFAPFQLMAYHMNTLGFADADIPLLFSLAMVFDAVAALGVGRFFDRFGLLMLGIIPAFTALISVLAFTQSYALIVLASLLWGVVMGLHETILRAGAASILPAVKRGFGFGALNAVLGFSWFVGGSVIGWLYNLGYVYIVAFSILIELSSVLPFILLIRRVRNHPT
ncbi:MAG: hypothetical protein QXJ86_05075, partial [Nitrososphaerales archaeon]